MFVPLFLTGGSFGVAFANSVAHSPAVELYAAVGMAAFIAGAYKTPLTAAVFVAEATGGHAYMVPRSSAPRWPTRFRAKPRSREISGCMKEYALPT